MNLWRCDLLQQWNAHTNIPPISETNYTLAYVSGKNIRRYYKEQPLITQIVQEQGTTTADLSKQSYL